MADLLDPVRRRDENVRAVLMGFVSGCPWSPGDLKDSSVGEMIKEVCELSYKFADGMEEARGK